MGSTHCLFACPFVRAGALRGAHLSPPRSLSVDHPHRSSWEWARLAGGEDGRGSRMDGVQTPFGCVTHPTHPIHPSHPSLTSIASHHGQCHHTHIAGPSHVSNRYWHVRSTMCHGAVQAGWIDKHLCPSVVCPGCCCTVEWGQEG